MRAHYLQHVPFEGLGSIALWLQDAGYEVTATKFFESVALPDLELIDLVIVMGGPMGVNDEEDYPWMMAEKQFIRRAIDSGTALLGICLGAQLIASTLGAAVYKNTDKEIGWYPIQGDPSLSRSALQFSEGTAVFHWHGETFDLPDGAILLASSKGCKNQAFQFNNSVVGLQFHLEITPESARAIVANCGDELCPAKYVQTKAEILASAPELYRSINALMAEVLTFIVADKS